jgi:2-polyprenyl-3-methyl-5-hydroxy-6-metoxy-1,4-benzoquinol methylase
MRISEYPGPLTMVCPLCGATAKRTMVLPHTQVWHCRSASCDLQFAWPQLDDKQLSRAYERLYYPEHGSDVASEPLAPTTEMVLHQLFDSVKEHYPDMRGKHILDYGCGSAVLAGVAREYGMVPTGIEPDLNARAEVKDKQICAVYADVDQLLLANPEARFDCIVLWNVIEHLRYPWLEMRRLLEVCTTDTLLIAATPNADCIRARFMREKWEERVNLTHFYYFTRTSLAATFRLAGFDPVNTDHRFTAYPHHGQLRRLAQRMLVACRLDGKLEFWAKPEHSLSSWQAPKGAQIRVC